MQVDFLTLFILVSIIQGFLLGFLILFSKFFKSPANQYLGYTIIIVSISSLNNWFWELSTYPFIIDLLDLILWQFLFPVTLILFFSKAKSYPIQPYQKWLYLPFVLFTTINIIISLETHYQWYSLPISSKTSVFKLFYNVLSISSVAYALLLICCSFFIVFRYNNSKALAPQPAVTKWFKTIWIWITLLMLLWIPIELLKVWVGRISSTIILTSFSMVIYVLIYKGLYQFKLANDQFEIKKIMQDRLINTRSVSSPISQPSSYQHYFDQLTTLLLQEKLHRNPDLSREDIAKRLEISSGYLSQILQHTSEYSFPELINHYRIQDVKEMIVDPDFCNYSLVAIGLEAGFKSKSNFYTSFKKATGLTPGQYQKQA